MIQVEAMLFDLDGTLIDSKSDLARSINMMLAEVGRPSISEDTVGSFVGDGVRVLVYRSLTATHPRREPPDVDLHTRGIELMHKHYSEQMLVSTRLYPGVAETLRFFGGKRKALVTSKEVRFAKIILNHFSIAEDFDVVVGGDTVRARKPDPAPVIEAVRLLRCQPGPTVMVGDTENDILAGQRAGTRTCGATFGFRTVDQIRESKPDVLISTFPGLRDHFC